MSRFLLNLRSCDNSDTTSTSSANQGNIVSTIRFTVRPSGMVGNIGEDLEVDGSDSSILDSEAFD